MLKCDICGTILLRPVPLGIHQVRCPFDDFEFTYDNNIRQPIEKLYYVFYENIEYCLEVDLQSSTISLRITRDKLYPDNDDLLIIEDQDFDTTQPMSFELAKQLIEEAKDNIPINKIVNLLKQFKK